MNDHAIACFQEDFERFHDLCVAQIDACPDELWLQKCGGYPLWQQFLHSFACIELLYVPPMPNEPLVPEQEFAAKTGLAFGCGCDRETLLLMREATVTLSKAEMRAYAGKMKALALAFLGSLDASRLGEPHEQLSAALGKPRTVQHALLGMVRHACYHLGCVDAVLRDRGLPGVY